MPAPDATELGLELLPADDPQVTAEEDLAAAERSALDADTTAVAGEARTPYGRSWSFDFERGRFNRRGSAPAVVTGRDSLAMWLGLVTRSARFTHALWSDDTGMERPEDMIGQASPQQLSDLQDRVTEAVTGHDRVTDLVEFDLVETGGQAATIRFAVVTDDDDAPLTGEATIEPGDV